MAISNCRTTIIHYRALHIAQYSNHNIFSLPKTSPHIKLQFHQQWPSSKVQLITRQRCLQQQQDDIPVQPEKHEQMEKLIGDITDELSTMAKTESDEMSLLDKLTLVDLIERLGIPRFFEEQISMIMRAAFRRWDEKYGFGDAETTVLAFRLLRNHGFLVSTDGLENLKDEYGSFSYFSMEAAQAIQLMVNMYKCSQTGFPSESILMEEVKNYCISWLRNELSEGNAFVLQTDLESEIKFALEYPKKCLLWRLESRSITKQMWPKCTGLKRKCLQLAKLDLTMLQKIHNEEIDEVVKWWQKQGFSKLTFARSLVKDMVLKCYFSTSMEVFEPEYAAFRVGFTKFSCFATLADDLFDQPIYSSNGLQQFIEAFKRQDPSLLDDLPDHQIILTSLINNIMDVAEKSSMIQSRDLLPFIKGVWEDHLDACLKEDEWSKLKKLPALEEYLPVASTTIACNAIIWTTMFLLGVKIDDKVMNIIGPNSRFVYLVSLATRLSNDVATIEKEAKEGKLATSINCYIHENPNCSVEEAISAVNQMIESSCQELEYELFMSRGIVPECCSRALMLYARAILFVYKRADAYSSTASDSEFEDLVRDFMFGSFE